MQRVRKIRQLIAALRRAGFVNRGGKGSHRNFVHPDGVEVLVSGHEGDDVPPVLIGKLVAALQQTGFVNRGGRGGHLVFVHPGGGVKIMVPHKQGGDNPQETAQDAKKDDDETTRHAKAKRLTPLDIVFAGTPGFAARHLAALLRTGHRIIAVYTQPDRPGRRGHQLHPSPVKALALKHGLPVHQPNSLKHEDPELRGLKPDLMIVVAYGQLLPQTILDRPRLGCINVHASLLPRWRGAAPIQRAIASGDHETGICIMQMDAGLDTGDILASARCPIRNDDTAVTLSDRLADLGCRLLPNTLVELAAGHATATPQPATGISYAAKITKQDAWIDWTDTAADIARKIRALNPQPIARTRLHAPTLAADPLTLRIWQAEAETRHARHQPPGNIVGFDKRALRIACGDGCLAIQRLQLPLGKGTVMSAADLLNARRDHFPVGLRLT